MYALYFSRQTGLGILLELLTNLARLDLDTAVLKDIKEHVSDVSLIEAKHPLHGIGRVEDVVGTAVFLASGEARWITGVNLPVDGGYTAQ